MKEKIHKAITEYPLEVEKVFMTWYDKMPELAEMSIDEILNGYHIYNNELYEKGLQFIKDKNGDNIELWKLENIIKMASGYVDFEDVEFTKHDLAFWVNVKKGDYYHIENDSSKIIKIAISDLTDKDYPFCNASELPYRWIKKHIEEKEED